MAIHGAPEDIIWLAGLAEGEATFDLHKGKYPRVRIEMTDRDVIGRAATLMDTGIRMSLHPAPAKATFHAEVSGRRAAAIMQDLLPHMGARRSARIAEILGHYEFAKPDHEGRKSMPGPKLTRPKGIIKPTTAE